MVTETASVSNKKPVALGQVCVTTDGRWGKFMGWGCEMDVLRLTEIAADFLFIQNTSLSRSKVLPGSGDTWLSQADGPLSSWSAQRIKRVRTEEHGEEWFTVGVTQKHPGTTQAGLPCPAPVQTEQRARQLVASNSA